MADSNPAVRQRKANQKHETRIVPDEELPSEDEDNLFAGTPSEKLRPVKTNSPDAPKTKSKRKSAGDVDGYSIWIDALRVLSFLAIASCGLSYVMSGGESWTWGYKNKPQFLRAQYWKLLIVRSPLSSPSPLSEPH